MEETQRKTIGFVTAHYDWNKAYSITSVMHDQLVMNIKNGYKTILFTLAVFKDDAAVPAGVEIRKIIPQFTLESYKGLNYPQNYKDEVKQITEALTKYASDCNILITHDLHFVDTFTPYCAAIHYLCDTKQIKAKWLLWTHSAPSSKPTLMSESPHNFRYKLPLGAKLVYLNNYHSLHLAEMYNTMLSEVRVVPNSVDPRTFSILHPLVESLINKYNLLSADYMGIYPLSSTRMVPGKQVHKAVKVMAKLKARGYNIKYVICNAHANAEHEKKTIQELQEMFMGWGLSSSEVIFTSLEETPKYEQGVPREVVSQLFQLSNVFIFPTTSENCSLILMEAMLNKNILVLNDDARMLREFGKDNALYFKFSGQENVTNYDNEEQYYNDIAKIIENQMLNNKPLRAQRDLLKLYNIDYIFKRYIEPLYYENL